MLILIHWELNSIYSRVFPRTHQQWCTKMTLHTTQQKIKIQIRTASFFPTSNSVNEFTSIYIYFLFPPEITMDLAHMKQTINYTVTKLIHGSCQTVSNSRTKKSWRTSYDIVLTTKSKINTLNKYFVYFF